jgi:hypothetical protein
MIGSQISAIACYQGLLCVGGVFLEYDVKIIYHRALPFHGVESAGVLDISYL